MPKRNVVSFQRQTRLEGQITKMHPKKQGRQKTETKNENEMDCKKHVYIRIIFFLVFYFLENREQSIIIHQSIYFKVLADVGVRTNIVV
jgi:hypothetical protein